MLRLLLLVICFSFISTSYAEHNHAFLNISEIELAAPLLEPQTDPNTDSSSSLLNSGSHALHLQRLPIQYYFQVFIKVKQTGVAFSTRAPPTIL